MRSSVMTRTGRIAALAGAATLTLAGCSGALPRGLTSSRTILEPADFGNPNVAPTRVERPVDPLIARATVTDAGTARRGLDVVAATGDPALSVVATPVEEPVFVDAKIGDVNGKPVFASAFFDRGTSTSPPLGPRLSAEAARRERGPWLRFAREQISQTLQGFVVDELLEAEARSELTDEQRQGLRYFVGTLQRNLISENRGSRTRAEQALGGRSVYSYEREREQELLIQQKLRELQNRVNVSWRDVQQEYERRPDLYDPPSIARFRVISVNAAYEADVEKVRQDLAAGRSFAEVAADPVNALSALEGGQQVRSFRGDMAEAKFFDIPELNEATKGLAEGAYVGPVRIEETGDRADLYWVMLEDLVAEQRSLYDNQLVIAADLQTQRARREREIYINRLAERASFTSLDEMTDRLLTIAATRYLPRDGG